MKCDVVIGYRVENRKESLIRFSYIKNLDVILYAEELLRSKKALDKFKESVEFVSKFNGIFYTEITNSRDMLKSLKERNESLQNVGYIIIFDEDTGLHFGGADFGFIPLTQEAISEHLSVFYDMDFDKYLQIGKISTSDIKAILDNPFAFFKGIKKEKTPSMAFGSLCHSLILEPHKTNNLFAIEPICDKRTKEGKATYEQFISSVSDNMEIVKPDVYNKALELVESFKKTPLFSFYVENAKYEVVAQNDIFKGRADIYNKKEGFIADLKIVSDSSAEAFARLAGNLRYYIQAYIYMQLFNVDKFYFIAIESKEPYTSAIYELDKTALDLAKDNIDKALKTLQEIRENEAEMLNVRYSDIKDVLSPKVIALPNYVFYEQ